MVDMSKIIKYRSEARCIHEYTAKYIIGSNRLDYANCNPCKGECPAYTSINIFSRSDIVRLTAEAEKRQNASIDDAINGAINCERIKK